MPTVEENRNIWNDPSSWAMHGDEWSKSWGGTEGMWWAVLLPRIHRFLHVSTILEIGPGHGRWTQYLRQYCKSLIVVDLSQACIDACRERFSRDSHISYYVNNGNSLDMVPDATIDFAFSFDSLVHAEADVIESYVRQLASKLTPQGVGFIHHSNLGEYGGWMKFTRFTMAVSRVLPHRLGERARRKLLNGSGWRAETVTARLFDHWCRQNQLYCIGQELVNWENRRRLTDCLSIFTSQKSVHLRPSRVWRNPAFMREAEQVRHLSLQYMRP